MRFALTLSCALFVALAQAQTKIDYVYSFHRDTSPATSRLQSSDHVFIASPRLKVQAREYTRTFTLDGVEYRWKFVKKQPSLLYRRDSVVADVANIIKVGDATYTIDHDGKTYVYRRNGVVVLTGELRSSKSQKHIVLTFNEPQGANQETLIVLATYQGLALIESRKGQVLGFIGGFAVGFLIGSSLQ